LPAYYTIGGSKERRKGIVRLCHKEQRTGQTGDMSAMSFAVNQKAQLNILQAREARDRAKTSYSWQTDDRRCPLP